MRPIVPPLDEATSSLDNRTEEQMTDVGGAPGHRIVIACWLSTTFRTARIYVLAGVRLSGTCKLMSSRASFVELRISSSSPAMVRSGPPPEPGTPSAGALLGERPAQPRSGRALPG